MLRSFIPARVQIAQTVLALALVATTLLGHTPIQATTDTRLTATYVGGSATDYGDAIGLDEQGNIYLASSTFSSSILNRTIVGMGGSEIAVAKLSPDASQLLGFFSIGSSMDDAIGGMAVTPQGEVVLAVNTNSDSFPTKNAIQPTPDEDNPGVLLKINAAMTNLVFSTYTDFTVMPNLHNVGVDGAGNIVVVGYIYTPVGRDSNLSVERFSPSGQQLSRKVWDNDTSGEPKGIAVQPNGTTYIAGVIDGRWTTLTPTDNAVQKVCGGQLTTGSGWCDEDAFVIRVSPADEIEYTTFLGGSGSDKAVDIAVDAKGAMYVVGWASGQDFPTTANAIQPRCRVASPDDLCYYDMFVSKITPDGTALVYSTILASGDLSGLDYPVAIAVDAAGNATVTGYTASEKWPVKRAVQPALNAAPCPNIFQDRLCYDAVATTFTPQGQLAFSTYLGGKFDDYGADSVVGADGSIYLAGSTESLDFPATAGGVQPDARSGSDAFVARIGNATIPPQPPAGKQRVYLPLISR